jgi:hypothetical protein
MFTTLIGVMTSWAICGKAVTGPDDRADAEAQAVSCISALAGRGEYTFAYANLDENLEGERVVVRRTVDPGEAHNIVLRSEATVGAEEIDALPLALASKEGRPPIRC